MRSASIHNYGELKGVGRIVLISTLRRLFPHADEHSILVCWVEDIDVSRAGPFDGPNHAFQQID
jgi:hypothetical protein